MGQHYRESALAEEERMKHSAWQRRIQAGMGALKFFNCKCPSRIWGGLISQQENFECFCFQIILEMKLEVRRKRIRRTSARHNTCFSSNWEKACMAFFKKKTHMLTSGCKMTRNTQSPFSWKHARLLHGLSAKFTLHTLFINEETASFGTQTKGTGWFHIRVSKNLLQLGCWWDALRPASLTLYAVVATEYLLALGPGAQFVC